MGSRETDYRNKMVNLLIVSVGLAQYRTHLDSEESGSYRTILHWIRQTRRHCPSNLRSTGFRRVRWSSTGRTGHLSRATARLAMHDHTDRRKL